MEYDDFLQKLFLKAELRGIPLGGTFELTSRCSLDCKMCYIHESAADSKVQSREKPTEWWLELANAAQNAGMFTLLLTGGEPTIRRDFDEIYTYCNKLGLMVSVNTNATLLDEDKLKLFRELPPSRINITMYGMSRETYKNMCGNADAFDVARSNISRLKEQGTRIKLNFSATPYNSGDAQAVYDFARAEDIPIQAATYMFPPIRTEGTSKTACSRFTPEEAAAEQLKWRKSMLGDTMFRKAVELAAAGNPMAPVGECQEYPSEKLRCRAGKSTFWVTWDGNMLPCGMFVEPKTEIKDFADAWSYIRDKREEIELPGKCGKCGLRSVCDSCAAVTYAENGHFDAVPSYACAKASAYMELCREFIGNKT